MSALLLLKYYTVVTHPALTSAIATVPPGAWAVGVSGGADSVALLILLAARTDLKLHVVHLDHQTRGEESTADAAFVGELAERLRMPCTIALRSDVEATMPDLPANLSSRYRAARIALFRQVVVEENLAGVILAHHGDDQAETVMLRLLRGSGPMGLAAMEESADLGGLRILRPLLPVDRDLLRASLALTDQPWREDASNASDDYLRNRLRRLLATEPAIAGDLLALGQACQSLRAWTRRAAPKLEPVFAVKALAALPEILAAESSRAWLIERGVRPDKITPQTIAQFLAMARDAASPARAHFPGRILVRRKGGKILAG